jgi:hypothetical protein
VIVVSGNLRETQTLAYYGSSLVDSECGKEEPPLSSAATCWIVRSSSQYYKVIPTAPERIAAKNGRSTGNRGTVKLRVGSGQSATDDSRTKSPETYDTYLRQYI